MAFIGSYCLKYEIHDQLALCYQHQGEHALELQVYTSVAELWQAARGSSEWPACCRWACRMAQRTAELHARGGHGREAAAAVAAGLAFAEGHALQDQRAIFALMDMQLALAAWDSVPAGAGAAAVNASLSRLEALVGGGALGLPPGSAPEARAAALGLGLAGYWQLVLHTSLLQVMYLLRCGKLLDLNKSNPQQQQQQQQPAGTGGESPAPLPAVLQHLEDTLVQLRAATAAEVAAAEARMKTEAEAKVKAEGQQQQEEQEGARPVGQAAPSPPYSLPGLPPSLEPLLCLVAAHVVRTEGGRHRLALQYVQRGLQAIQPTLTELHVPGEAAEGGPETTLPAQSRGPARVALSLQLMLHECRAQVFLSRGDLVSARESLLACEQALERFPSLLRPAMGGGVHLLAGQYCAAAGAWAEAEAHLQRARASARSACSAALAAVLQAHVALAAPGAGDGVARALAALGPFFDPRRPVTEIGPGPAGGPPAGPLGHLESVACQLASAACLAQQGHMAEASTLLAAALKTAHRRLGHTQLVCGILCDLVPTFLAQQDVPSAETAATTANTFSGTAGDPWAGARSKRSMAAVLERQGNKEKAASMAAGAASYEQAIAAARAEAAADLGRHGYAAGWDLAR